MLIVVGIGLGVSACMTSLTVLYLMGSDPLPTKSQRLHFVQIDNWDELDAYNSTGDPPNQLAYQDATSLFNTWKGGKQAVMYRFGLPIQVNDPGVHPFTAAGRATTADFFSLFDVPFQYGTAWDKALDGAHARVVVLDALANEKLFGGVDSVGRVVHFDNSDFTVVGVLGDWNPRVKYYDLDSGKLSRPESFYIPFSTAIERRLGVSKSFADTLLLSENKNFGLWVELDSPTALADYRSFLDAYVEEQHRLGRLTRPLNNRLYNVVELMQKRHVVSRDTEAQSGLSILFLAVCLLNAVGLMLAKFTRKSGEIGVRRALGASRNQIFVQHVIETGIVGFTGGLLGLALAEAGLWLIRLLYTDYARVASMNMSLMLATLAVSVLISVLAGLYPCWRASLFEPAIQVKAQ